MQQWYPAFVFAKKATAPPHLAGSLQCMVRRLRLGIRHKTNCLGLA